MTPSVAGASTDLELCSHCVAWLASMEGCLQGGGIKGRPGRGVNFSEVLKSVVEHVAVHDWSSALTLQNYIAPDGCIRV